MRTRSATRLYIHVPFCRAKCAYCAFYSEVAPAPAQVSGYLEALERELSAQSVLAADLESVFVGGGTPSMLGPAGLARLMGAVRASFRIKADAEVTVEANPDRVDAALAEALAAAGVNRVSLGLQSFQPELLRTLGRCVDAGAAASAAAALRAVGIARLSADLIFQIPGQSLSAWVPDLREALGLGLGHLSTYALTLEEGTALSARLGAAGVDDSLFEAMWSAAEAEACRHGLRRYEISNFAAAGEECRHNLGIWLGDAYLGCGPAASSFDGGRRWTNVADLAAWMAGREPEPDELPARSRAAEMLAFGLRTVEGWDLSRFRALTGLQPEDLCGEAIGELVAAGLLEVVGGRLRTTPAGLLVHDAIAERLIILPGES
ncbi:MAG: radical SAM family heme chaperone HemW [Lentisphaerae bacterium]|nr:radical SAM family heme chaperone HemW [Lentisphaerota bacterium]